MNNQDHVALPECYVPCDGTEITEGIWKGRRTPDLNNPKRFLRGGHVSEALMVEEDSLQEHSHTSTVSDPGHSHAYTQWSYKGPPNSPDSSDGYPDLASDYNSDTKNYDFPWPMRSASEKSYISMSVHGVSGARTGYETRPKNMKVVFVMKVC